jgi:hypothetical protein
MRMKCFDVEDGLEFGGYREGMVMVKTEGGWRWARRRVGLGAVREMRTKN